MVPTGLVHHCREAPILPFINPWRYLSPLEGTKYHEPLLVPHSKTTPSTLTLSRLNGDRAHKGPGQTCNNVQSPHH